MRAEIRDKAIFEGISLEDLSSFLQASGWDLFDSTADQTQVWVNVQHPRFDDIVLPGIREVRDYALRVAEAVRILSRASERSELEVVRAIVEGGSDVVRLRRPSFNEADASIRLKDGASLVAGAFELLYAAATSAITSRAVLPTRRPLQAEDYMRRVELGQSERGSYVISLISRVTPLLTPGAPGLLEYIDEPFPRKVTKKLASALEAVGRSSHAVATSGDFSMFEESVPSGVSANLCDALALILQHDELSAPVDLEVDWARTRPVDGLRRHFSFSPADVPILTDAAKFLKRTEPAEGILFTGVVVDLHRDEGDLDGEVSVATVLEGSTRKLRAPLNAPEYQMAIDAHRDKNAIMFRADLTKRGRQWRAENVREFRVLE